MIKTILGKLEHNIPDLLPFGAINQLAKKHGFARQTITKMLLGQTGSEENVREVLKTALEILDKNSKLQTDTAQQIREKINSFHATA